MKWPPADLILVRPAFDRLVAVAGLGTHAPWRCGSRSPLTHVSRIVSAGTHMPRAGLRPSRSATRRSSV